MVSRVQGSTQGRLTKRQSRYAGKETHIWGFKIIFFSFINNLWLFEMSRETRKTDAIYVVVMNLVTGRQADVPDVDYLCWPLNIPLTYFP